jgi:hypothetical protein
MMQGVEFDVTNAARHYCHGMASGMAHSYTYVFDVKALLSWNGIWDGALIEVQ